MTLPVEQGLIGGRPRCHTDIELPAVALPLSPSYLPPNRALQTEDLRRDGQAQGESRLAPDRHVGAHHPVTTSPVAACHGYPRPVADRAGCRQYRCDQASCDQASCCLPPLPLPPTGDLCTATLCTATLCTGNRCAPPATDRPGKVAERRASQWTARNASSTSAVAQQQGRGDDNVFPGTARPRQNGVLLCLARPTGGRQAPTLGNRVPCLSARNGTEPAEYRARQYQTRRHQPGTGPAGTGPRGTDGCSWCRSPAVAELRSSITTTGTSSARPGLGGTHRGLVGAGPLQSGRCPTRPGDRVGQRSGLPGGATPATWRP
jgi:hypothetical protein